MSERASYADINTIGWSEELPAAILVDMRGPNGGKIGFGRITPDEARRAAQELIDAADMVDPPVSLASEHMIYFRGYQIEPYNAEHNLCVWHRASRFSVRPLYRAALNCSPTCMNDARQEVINDIASR